MTSVEKKINELKEYLKKAKEQQWTIAYDSLMEEYGLTLGEVKKCVNEIYYS